MDLNEAMDALAEDLSNSGWWGGEPRILAGEFGFSEVSVLRSGSDFAVNVPDKELAVHCDSPIGVPLRTDPDGAVELVAAGDGRLEILCVNAQGRLLNSDNDAILSRRIATAKLVREAALRLDHDTFVWASGRAQCLAAVQNVYRSATLPAPALVGDARAAAIASMNPDRWDVLAAAVRAHVGSDETQAFWHAALTTVDNGLVLSADALLVLSHKVWGGLTMAALTENLLLGVEQIEGAVRELEQIGFVQWPASLESVIEWIGMAELRNVLGPLGVKGQSKSVLVDRAIAVLGHDQVAQIAVDLGADLNQLAFTDAAVPYRAFWDEIDARAERLDRMAAAQVGRLPRGVPGDFGSQTVVQRYEVDDAMFADDEPGLPADATQALTDLADQLGQALASAAATLASPESAEKSVDLVQDAVVRLIALLASAARTSR